MSRITQKPSVAPLNPFSTVQSVASNYTGTATGPVSYEAYSANPANSASTATGTGFFDPNFVTYVGQKFDTSDGRELVLVANGGAPLAAGVLVQAPARIIAFSETALAVTVPTATPATAGTNQILVTNGSTVLNVNQYAGGYLIVSAGTGIGQTLKIASHAAGANGGTFIVTLEDAIQTTLDATSKVNLHYNPYGGTGGSTTAGTSAGVIISPTTYTGVQVGASITPIAASTLTTYTSAGAISVAGTTQYGLIVCHGPASVLNDSAATSVVGQPVSASGATPGAVCLTTVAKGIVGTAGCTGSASTNVLVYLTL